MSRFLLSVQEVWRASMAAGSVLLYEGVLGQHSYWSEGDVVQRQISPASLVLPAY